MSGVLSALYGGESSVSLFYLGSGHYSWMGLGGWGIKIGGWHKFSASKKRWGQNCSAETFEGHHKATKIDLKKLSATGLAAPDY